MKKIIPLLILYLFTSSASGITFEYCGFYEGEGYLQKKEKSFFLTLEKETTSEVNIKLNGFNEKENHDIIGTKVRMNFEILKRCNAHCVSKKFKIIKLIDPYKPLKPFLYPRPKPSPKKKCKDG